MERDMNVGMVKEINELAETKAQFQHMMDYFCTTLGISPPPPQQLCPRNQIDSLFRQKAIRIDQHNFHQVGLCGPSHHSKRRETTKVKDPTQEPP